MEYRFLKGHRWMAHMIACFDTKFAYYLSDSYASYLGEIEVTSERY